MDIRHEIAGHRGAFFIHRDGKRLAEMTFSAAGDTRIIIDHTDVSDELRGTGADARLLDDAAPDRHHHRREIQVITVIDTFQLPKPNTRDEARKIFLSTAPKYLGVAGLVRKYYVLSQDGSAVSGIYLWNSRAEAEAMFTESWRAFVREKYGTDPSVTYLECPVVVDNLTHEILSDE